MARIPAQQTREPLQAKSLLLAHWRGDRCAWRYEKDSNGTVVVGLDMITPGDPAVFARSGAVTGVDQNARNYTAPANVPRFVVGSDGRPRLLLVGTDGDRFTMPSDTPWRTCTLYTEFVERGSITTANARALFYGSKTSPTTDPRLYIESTGSKYQAVFDVGTPVTIALTGTAPVAGEVVELSVELDEDTKKIRLAQRIGGTVEEITAWSSAAASFPSALDANHALILGGHAGDGYGNAEFGVAKLSAANRTLDAVADEF